MNRKETVEEKRPQFGCRYLTSDDNVFKHNAWDNVEWNETLESSAKTKVTENTRDYVETNLQIKYETEAHEYWNKFYEIHENKFFKDRHWLFTEFPELAPGLHTAPIRVYPKQDITGNEHNECDQTENTTGTANNVEALTPLQDGNPNRKKFIFEIGCGAGNTVFPIMETNNDSQMFIYCCDFSKSAVDLVKNNSLYDSSKCEAFVCNITEDTWTTPFCESSLDIAILIFVLSAIHPNRMSHVIQQVFKYLKPGGLVLLRDYGRYDMAQLRFKNDEIRKLFLDAGFLEEQNLIDRRLQVNRGKQLTMYRVWVQSKYKKPYF